MECKIVLEQLLKYRSIKYIDGLFFQPKDLVRDLGISRYKVDKMIKAMRKDRLIAYTTFGGGCDDDGDPCTPQNGYVLTHKGVEELIRWKEGEGE